MFPLIHLFGREISTYGIMVGLGILACYLAVVRPGLKRCKDLKGTTVVTLSLWAALGLFLGAHLLYGLTHAWKIGYAFTHLDKVFQSWDSFAAYGADIFGGMVFYGGLIGAVIAAAIYLKASRQDMAGYADLLSPAIPLFHAFGRIGCFLGGCCYGVESPFGFVYTNSLVPEANGVSRFPVQLVEAAANFLLAICMLWLFHKKKPGKGRLILVYGLSYPVIRFILEFWRGDQIRGIFFGFSTSQWISIAVFAVSAAVVVCDFARSRKNRRSSAAV